MRALNNVRLGGQQVKIEFAKTKGAKAAPGATQLPDAGSAAEAAVPVGPKVRHRAVLKNLPVRGRSSPRSSSRRHTHTGARAHAVPIPLPPHFGWRMLPSYHPWQVSFSWRMSPSYHPSQVSFSWRELKDEMRRIGDVIYADVDEHGAPLPGLKPLPQPKP